MYQNKDNIFKTPLVLFFIIHDGSEEDPFTIQIHQSPPKLKLRCNEVTLP
jgi:hypothetical protein